MSSKQITKSEIHHLRNTLKGDDKVAIWTVLTLLKLSIKDKPVYKKNYHQNKLYTVEQAVKPHRMNGT